MRFICLVLIFSFAAHASPELNLKQATMLETLEQIISVFSEEYAPFEYKIKSANYNLIKDAESARAKIQDNPGITTPEFQDILTDFVSATRDFHVTISFLSTEQATLPFQLMQAQGRYFVIYIDRQKLPIGAMANFDVGTEITQFDGQPMAQAVRALVPERYKEPRPTELSNALNNLTNRQRRLGFKVPLGEVMLRVRLRSGEERDLPFNWEYTQEYVPNDIPLRNMLLPSIETPRSEPLLPTPLKEFAEPLTVGGKTTFVPPLGINLGSGNVDDFNSYIFRLPRGRVIGYARIATFNEPAASAKAKLFGELMASFEDKTDALVLDLTHNPGGYSNYTYALLAHLSAEPLRTLPEQIMVSQGIAAQAARFLAMAPFIRSEVDVHRVLGSDLQGLAFNFELFQSLVNYDRFLLSEIKGGRRLTNPTFFLGISHITPAAEHYSKPILVLTDELDFSCADFFPAILQDNKRVTIFGARTAGAGGSIKEVNFLNQFGIDKLTFTSTIAQRVDGSGLEGVGVNPDVPYAFTVRDMQEGFVDYKAAVVNTLEKMLR